MPYSDEDIRNAINFTGQVLQKQQEQITAQQKEIEAFKAQRGTEAFVQERDSAHGYLRDRGYSQKQIAAGETRMAREHVANYNHANKLGLFGEPEHMVIGGMNPDMLKRVMADPFNERLWDEHTRNVSSEDR
jgi:hypothetical protein